jgi:hypothetical protein
VVATDIFNKYMKVLWNRRWEKAFSLNVLDAMTELISSIASGLPSITSGLSWMTKAEIEASNLKATIVLERIIQVANVSHTTMQHWHIYKVSEGVCYHVMLPPMSEME